MEGFTRAHTLIEATDKDVNVRRYAAAGLKGAHDELAEATRATAPVNIKRRGTLRSPPL
jgi:hypothetical protein